MDWLWDLLGKIDWQWIGWMVWRFVVIVMLTWGFFTTVDYVSNGKKDPSRFMRFVVAMTTSLICAYLYDYMVKKMPWYIVAWHWIPFGMIGFGFYIVLRKKIDKSIILFFRSIPKFFGGLLNIFKKLLK